MKFLNLKKSEKKDNTVDSLDNHSAVPDITNVTDTHLAHDLSQTATNFEANKSEQKQQNLSDDDFDFNFDELFELEKNKSAIQNQKDFSQDFPSDMNEDNTNIVVMPLSENDNLSTAKETEAIHLNQQQFNDIDEFSTNTSYRSFDFQQSSANHQSVELKKDTDIQQTSDTPAQTKTPNANVIPDNPVVSPVTNEKKGLLSKFKLFGKKSTNTKQSQPKNKATNKGLFAKKNKPFSQDKKTSVEKKNDSIFSSKTKKPSFLANLFNKEKSVKSQKPAGKQTLSQNNKIILAVLAMVVMGGLLFLFMSQQTTEEPTVAESVPVQSVTPPPAPVPAQPQVTPPENTVTESSTTADTTENPEGSLKTINPNEILQPELPQDTAIAREEIDRLADQSKLLAEQEALIEKQLETMNELSSKKEERIALLEQQIAQLEKAQQNSQSSK